MKANPETAQGHWLLAKMGKRVLRPGGKELTLKMIDALQLNRSDSIVEFAPGLGFTASISLKHNPASYTGVELDKNAAAFLGRKITGKNAMIVQGNARKTTLPDECATKVYGEAMLTMQSDKQKSEIIQEAHRILKQGGLYGIHEIALSPEGSEPEVREGIYKEMKEVIRANVAPISVKEWEKTLIDNGFRIVKVMTNPMHLLEKKRIVDDEGFIRFLKIIFNIMTHPKARNRIKRMRQVFRKNEKNIFAISIISEKI